MGWFLPLGDGWFQPLLGCVHDFRAFEAASVRCFNTAYCKSTVSSGMTGLVGTSAHPPHAGGDLRDFTHWALGQILCWM